MHCEENLFIHRSVSRNADESIFLLIYKLDLVNIAIDLQRYTLAESFGPKNLSLH